MSWHAGVVRLSKRVGVTLSVSAGLAVLGGILVLPTYLGAVLTLGIAMLWCWWLEQHPTIDSNLRQTLVVFIDASTLPLEQRVEKKGLRVAAGTSVCANVPCIIRKAYFARYASDTGDPHERCAHRGVSSV